MTRVRGLPAVLVVALAAAALPATGQATPTGTNGPIAYVRSDDPAGSDPQIWLMGADGSSPGRLTTSTNANYSRPSFTQSGSKLAFAAQGPSSPDVFTMDFAGTNIADLSPDTAIDSSPAISPDGTKVAYSVYLNSNYEIFVRPTAGGAATQLTNNAAGVDDINPAWSPDGTKIAYSSTSSGSYDLWIMSATDGSGKTQMTHTMSTVNSQYVREQYPAWSPDGTKIAYARMESNLINDLEAFDLWVMSSTTPDSGAKLAGSSTGKDTQPAWSPDGTKIVFASDRSSSGDDIWVVNSDGSGTATDLTGTSSPVSEAQPVWGQPQQPSAQWNGAAPVVATAATVNGKIGTSCMAGTWYTEWSQGSQLPVGGGTKTATQNITSCAPANVSSQLTGLSPNTTYTARFLVTNPLGTAASNPQTFTTPADTGGGSGGTDNGGGGGGGTDSGTGGTGGGSNGANFVVVTPPFAAPPQGTSGDDRLIGTPGPDVLKGFGGQDVLAGLGGNDLLDGGSGRDILDGGPGNDHLIGGSGDDDLDGGADSDNLSGGTGADVLHGGDGNDHMRGDQGSDHISGGPGNDTIDARDGTRDVVDCGPGKKDTVLADKLDRVRGCERVLFRAPRKKK